MKKLNKIVALIGMMVIMAIALTGCELKSNKKAIDKKELTGYTEYTHSSGVKFSYPEEWKSLGTTSKPVFADANNGTNVNLLSENVPSGYNLTSYMSASIANIKKKLESKIKGDVSEEEVKLNGKDASIITYIMSQDGVDVNIKQACFIDDKTAYILTTATTADENDTEIIDNIISSFTK